MARELGMAFVPKLSWDEGFSPPRDLAAVRATTGGYASRTDFREKHGDDYMRMICHQLSDSPQINWDGKVIGCCRNTWANFGANAFQEGLVPAVNSERMSHARQMLLGRAAPRDDVPCTTCELYQGMRESGHFLRRDDADRGQRFTLDETLELAAEWETAGRREDAISVYRRILAAQPSHPEAARRLAAHGAEARACGRRDAQMADRGLTSSCPPVERAPRVSFQAGIEELLRVFDRGSASKGKFHDLLV